MARIAVDMDEVIADTLGEHIRRYNNDFGASVRKSDLDGKWLREAVPEEHHAQLRAYMDEPGFFGELEVLPDAQRVLERLSRDHEVFIASAAMEVPMSFAAKFRWMERHFPFIAPSHMVFCGDKSILLADFLIDDNPRQLRAFRGQGLLFASPHNLYATEWPRMEGWLQIEQFFYENPASRDPRKTQPGQAEA
jgi:5'(3')-deoxyribonucleotidase